MLTARFISLLAKGFQAAGCLTSQEGLEEAYRQR